MISWFKHLDRVLRGEATRPSELSKGTIEIPTFGLTTVVIILGFVYGICMGCFGLMRVFTMTESDIIRVPVGEYNLLIPWQLIATTLKVPALFLLTLLVTFPSLYVFNALVGSRLLVRAAWRLLIATLGVTLAVLASLGPVVAFFSVSTSSYPFMVLLNVVIYGVAGMLGLKFLLQTLNRLTMATRYNITEPVEAEVVPSEGAEAAAVTPTPKEVGALEKVHGHFLGKHVMTIFRIWVIVFGLIGAQMSWVLRPFVGDPSTPFTWFRPRESNFFQAVADAIFYMLHGG
jgi:hypothetical protein